MQLALRLRQAATALVSGALLPVAAPGMAGAGLDENEAGARLGWFSDSDGVRVASTAGRWGALLSRSLRFDVEWDRESVTVPGVSAAPGSQEALDSISGASRPISTDEDPYADFVKIRQQMTAVFGWSGASASYYVSDESDYFAQQVSGGWRSTLFDENLTLDLGASWGWDDIRPVDDADTETAGDRKTTAHVGLVVTQVATPTTVVQLGLEANRVEGLQHNPYRNVYVAGGYEAERHPDRRERWDGFFKVNQYLPFRASVKGDWKYYSDDWGIRSHTVGSKLHQYVGEGFVVRHRYRFYRQTAAEFWRGEYLVPGGIDGLRTVDYRLGSYTAHLFGTKVTWDLNRVTALPRFVRDLAWSMKYERYFNSNNFSANILESGLAFSF